GGALHDVSVLVACHNFVHAVLQARLAFRTALPGPAGRGSLGRQSDGSNVQPNGIAWPRHSMRQRVSTLLSKRAFSAVSPLSEIRISIWAAPSRRVATSFPAGVPHFVQSSTRYSCVSWETSPLHPAPRRR